MFLPLAPLDLLDRDRECPVHLSRLLLHMHVTHEVDDRGAGELWQDGAATMLPVAEPKAQLAIRANVGQENGGEGQGAAG